MVQKLLHYEKIIGIITLYLSELASARTQAEKLNLINKMLLSCMKRLKMQIRYESIFHNGCKNRKQDDDVDKIYTFQQKLLMAN